MDATSLILQIKASGLNVDTAPLEAILLKLSQTLQSHDAVVSKFPKVEAAQGDLRRDINKLLESVKASADDCIATGSLDESKACDGEDEASRKGNDPSTDSDGTTSSSYGVRKMFIEPIHTKHADASSNANDRAIAGSLRDVKSAIHRLQQHRDEGLVNSMEVDESIKSLKESLFETQQKLMSSATIEQMQVLQQSLIGKYSQMQQRLQEFKTTFHEDVDGSINRNLSEVKSWFKDLEALVKQRQAKLEQRVASCAREYDVAAFRESIETNVASLTRKAAFLDDTARAQGKTLVMLQQKNAITMFHRHYTNWKQNALKCGLSCWKEMVKRQIQYEEGKESQKRLVRKTLTNIMSRRKRFGFERWIRYRDWHRRGERMKIKASTLICERLGSYLAAPKTVAFNRWRRLTLMDKMKSSRDGDAVGEEKSSSSNLSSDPSPIVLSSGNQKKPTFCLSSIMESFKGDLQGATYALAMEIESIKSHDIASMRQDWCTENQRLMSTIHNTMNEAISKVEDTSHAFQDSVNERVDSCTDDFPQLQAKLDELTGLFERCRAELKGIDESHKGRIDALFDRNQHLDRRLHAVEKRNEAADRHISTLSEEQSKSNESIQYMRGVIAKNEERHEEQRNLFQQALDHFGEELLKTKVTLGHTQVRCESLEKELAETKSELVHFQDACQSENDMVRRQIHYPGVPKPSLARIVDVGHAYESLAKEKNYVMSINVMATSRTTSKMKMKRSGQNVKNEEEVDVPSEIVAFAHDYAAWVAYQADHESLLRLIVGTNPEEQVYAEDDIISRRKELCGELKSDLGTLLEKASAYQAVADKKDPSSSCRGLGLRWEARAIFLARLAEATEVALSKHDQILPPASTRLGRVRPLSANVTICVACDRPMRQKGTRNGSAPATAERKSSGGKRDNLLPDGSMPSLDEDTPPAGIRPVLGESN
ncbi:hypothetical protein ACHAWF_017325 [Thalassiosira exigua]